MVTGLRMLVAEANDFPAAAVDELQRFGTVRLEDLDRSGLLRAVGDADLLWVRLRHLVDGEVMRAAPALRVIATPTTGLTHVDLAEANARGIHVASLRGEGEFLADVRATAEHTVGLILALMRQLPAAAVDVAEGRWNRDRFRGHELYGKTVGIVGCGRLGRLVARYLRPFEVRILACDPYSEPEGVKADEVLDLDALLDRSEIVTLHASLRDDNVRFFGRAQFRMMRRGAWFVNTARGELVDEVALLEAVASGHLAGAAVDVLADEQSTPIGEHPLVRYARHHPNLLITPHLGGCTVESLRKTEVFLAQKVCRLLACLR